MAMKFWFLLVMALHLMVLMRAYRLPTHSLQNDDDFPEPGEEEGRSYMWPIDDQSRCSRGQKRDSADSGDCGGGEGDKSDGTDEHASQPKLKIQPNAYRVAAKAALEAQEALNQQKEASREASQFVRKVLAQKAAQAAKSAEADYMSKLQVLQHLILEVRQANATYDEKREEILKARRNYRVAANSYARIRSQFQNLKKALMMAERNYDIAEEAHEGAMAIVERKKFAIDAGRDRIKRLKLKLQVAQAELEKTKAMAKQIKDSNAKVIGAGNGNSDDCQRTSDGGEGGKFRRPSRESEGQGN